MSPVKVTPAPSEQHLANSKLAPKPQMEMMGGDVDIESFNLMMRDKAGIKLTSVITSADIRRTIEGASVLTVVVDDDLDRTIQNSGRLGKKVDVNVNGLWFTLVGVRKAGRSLTLTFEEREVNVLRYYNSFIMADRTDTRRTEFVLRLIQEVKEIPLKWIIPELHSDSGPVSDLTPGQVYITPGGDPLVDPANYQPATRGKGIPAVTGGLTVKGSPATLEQIQNANIILDTAVRMGANGKVMVAAIMTAITESTIHNYTGGDRDSVGVFQQRASMGWPATRNIATDAAEFIKRAMARDKQYPGESYAMLCQDVQHSAYSDGSNYAPYQAEAEAWVRNYGATLPKDKSPDYNISANTVGQPEASGSEPQYYTRGTVAQMGDKSNSTYILTKEDSWTCMQRLAGEIGWRCFCISGTIYFISDNWLFRSKPFMTINEDHDGIDWIDYDYDEGKKVATVTVTCHLSRWSAPPGSVVAIANQCTLVDGRYLVNDVQRSLYDATATITLKKPRPELPEPTQESSLPPGFPGPEPPQPAGARNGGVEMPASVIQQRIVSYARAAIGLPYKHGGENPGQSFDCSGLTQAAYSSVGISIPRVAADQYAAGPQLSTVEILQPGDLVFFGASPSSIHHVGIYIGGGAMVDAPHTGAFVRVDDNFRTSWGDYYGATRPWLT
jgi:hypothetical protein